MISSEAVRTLVKSPPELWTLLSDPDSLARQLIEFGEIRIVGSEPESVIAWEGEDVSGTIQLKASGWGTKVTLTVARQPPAPPEPEPEPVVEPEPEPKVGFFARIFRRRKPEPVVEPEAPEPEKPNLAAELQALEESLEADTTTALTAVLDRLGAAHHRPFSRA
jgi:hypothetical protein